MLPTNAGFLIVFVCGLCALPGAAQQGGNALAGCLVGEPGNFTLGAVPSGNSYRVVGDNALLNAHRHQLVRVTGNQSGEGKTATISVQKLDVLADTCTASLSPENQKAVRGVTGKTGAEGTAVNTTDTRTAGEITPGSQTEAGEAQQPGRYTQVPPGTRNEPPSRGPLAPPQWDQVGQDQQTADRSAAVAKQAEQRPNQTLGVDAMPSYTNPQKPQGSAETKR